MNIDREELELSDLMTECLAIFEGGDIREDFDSAWVLFVIEDMVDSFKRIKNLVKERKDFREYVTTFAPISLRKAQTGEEE